MWKRDKGVYTLIPYLIFIKKYVIIYIENKGKGEWKMCSGSCCPACSYCVYKTTEAGKPGCSLHPEEKYQWLAQYDNYCKDFKCMYAKEHI